MIKAKVKVNKISKIEVDGNWEEICGDLVAILASTLDQLEKHEGLKKEALLASILWVIKYEVWGLECED